MIWGAIAGFFALLFGSKAVASPSRSPAGTLDPVPLDPFFQWDDLIHRYSSSYGIPFHWMKGIMIVESNLGQAKSVARGLASPTDIEGSKSSDGKSWGLMQLTLGTARMFESGVTEADLNDPETSVRLSAKYLKWLMSKNPAPYSQEEFVIRGYNGGAGFAQTRLGQQDTPIYYQKWKAAVERIKARQAI